MKPRSFLIPEATLAPGETATVTGNLFRHMVKVLRLKKGMPVRLIDGSGCEFLATVASIEKETLRAVVEEAVAKPVSVGGDFRITLYQGLPRGEKMDLIVQKTTELGVSRIVPVVCTRSVAKPEGTRSGTKISRWRKIAEEAARQSERGVPPEIREVADFKSAIAAASEEARVMLWEEERNARLKELLGGMEAPPGEIALLVGPEGGLTAEEAALAAESGFVSVGLGPRILRTETAAIASVAVVQFAFGDLG